MRQSQAMPHTIHVTHKAEMRRVITRSSPSVRSAGTT